MFPLVSSADYTDASVKYTIRYFFSKYGDSVVQQAYDVAKCESRFNEMAHNKTDKYGGSFGVFQINGIHGFTPEYLYIPYNNIKEAEKLYAKRKWKDWTCQPIKSG